MSTPEARLCHCRMDMDDDEDAPIRAGRCPDCGADRFLELGRVRAYLGTCPQCEGSVFTEEGDFLNACPGCGMDQRVRFHVVYAKFHDMAGAALTADPGLQDADCFPPGEDIAPLN